MNDVPKTRILSFTILAVCVVCIGIFASFNYYSYIGKPANIIIAYILCGSISSILIMAAIMFMFLSEFKNNKIMLENYMNIDEVTGRSNYNKFLRDAKNYLMNSNGQKYAIVTIDINKFKYINDIFGYEQGNKILKHISGVIYKTLKNGETFARIQGDCFAILLKYDKVDQLKIRLNNLLSGLSKNKLDDNKHCEIIVYMGVFEVTDLTMKVYAMVDRALTVSATIKGGHKSEFVFYNDSIRKSIIREKELENEMYRAIEQEQFEVYYHPKYCTNSLELVGAEALVRWNHSKDGLLTPSDFLDFFEKNGFITNIDLYVFERVCKQIKEWKDEGRKIVPISVNLSRVHLKDLGFIDEFEQIMKKYEVSPEYIEFEITENTVVNHYKSLIKVLNSMHKIGCLVSMDDFGSGYSSLNMLKEINVDILKLDREFLNRATESERGKQIILSVVNLAKELNISVVAEGVEDAEQFKFLKEIDCPVAQGFYLSHPIKVEEFGEMLI